MASSLSQRKQPIVKVEPSYNNSHTGPLRQPAIRGRLRLVSYDEIPAWYQDNEYIRHGYRPESASASACFASWGYLHNETFNIYSHLVPAILFLFAQAFIAQSIRQSFPDVTAADYLVFAFFLLTAFLTLSTSFLYHTLLNHSMRISHLWLRLDFIGVLFLTLGDFVSGIYLVFYCEATLQRIYWAMVCTFRSVFCNLSEKPPTRMPHVALVPFVHVLIMHSDHQPRPAYRRPDHALSLPEPEVALPSRRRLRGHRSLRLRAPRPRRRHPRLATMWVASGMPYYLLEGAILLVGALFYAARFPESAKPGRFDIWGIRIMFSTSWW